MFILLFICYLVNSIYVVIFVFAQLGTYNINLFMGLFGFNTEIETFRGVSRNWY